MWARTEAVDITCDGSGDATEYSSILWGRLVSIMYIKNDFASGVDFTITGETTGQGIWTQVDVNATTVRGCKQQAHNTSGTAITNEAQDIILPKERIKFVISSGGTTGTTGQFRIFLA